MNEALKRLVPAGRGGMMPSQLMSHGLSQECGASTTQISGGFAANVVSRSLGNTGFADTCELTAQVQNYAYNPQQGSLVTTSVTGNVVNFDNLTTTTGTLTTSVGYLTVTSCGGTGTSNITLTENPSASTSAQLFYSPTDALVADLQEMRELQKGWDGEEAAAPLREAIRDAILFVRAIGDFARCLEPTPDIDGSILLEIGDGSDGSLRFRGDHTIIYAIRGAAPGIVKFDDEEVPEQISEALEAA